MNPWFDRVIEAAGLELDGLTAEEAARLLDLAGAAARSAGARQFAPLVTYLAGRAAAAGPAAERLAVIDRLLAATAAAGPAEADLGL